MKMASELLEQSLKLRMEYRKSKSVPVSFFCLFLMYFVCFFGIITNQISTSTFFTVNEAFN
jgi:hypothetical protein